MRPVSIVGIGQVPVKKKYQMSLRELGTMVVQQAMADASIDRVDALFAGNMLSDELQRQKHLASLIADTAGLRGVEAMTAGAATASGAAALRLAYLAVASGDIELAVAVGVEKMSAGEATPILAKALDAQLEVPDGATLVSQNARLMALYLERYAPPDDALAHFSANAHRNATHNPYALFPDRPVTPAAVLASRLISPPIRLLDCAPICDGAAAVVLAPGRVARAFNPQPVDILASGAASDRFRIADRPDPLHLVAAERSLQIALRRAGLKREDINFFELHDAFSSMACLLLEATGFAVPGEGWRLAVEGDIRLDGRLPIATMGGLKARGHPIGATALYQACEIVLQLNGRAGENQLPDPRVGLMQSVGGTATTVISHILAAPTITGRRS